ncbi:MAG TPA: allantoinase AllB [Bryobacteraceae bacterium]|jgi:allantoinase|nr:allantoinase AllB [Bryobacteraceae bacterium]
MPDLVVRGDTEDIAIEDGKIVAIGPDLAGGTEEIDARGLHLFPGLIDVHLHFNEPGRTEWEGAATGSRALAAGGGTLFFDMPLNSTPCTVDVEAFDRKHAALTQSSITDFALWGGLIPGNVSEMAPLADRGVVGFKAFLCDSGLPEFPRVDDLTLFEGLREAARLGLPIAVHAESQEITQGLAQKIAPQDRGSVRAFLASRPVIAELEAIQRATLLAREAGAKLHIVHVSSGRGVALAAEARAQGTDVSIETCPHYLFFTEDDVERLGAVAKCAPPLRNAAEQEGLWTQLLRGAIDIVASDHSPAPPEMRSGDFTRAWGGIAGVQSTLSVLIDRGYHCRQLSLEQISSLIAVEPARRFRIQSKGSVAIGMDADLAIVDVFRSAKLQSEHLMQRHALSPYLGCSFRGGVVRTIRRGETIFTSGKITSRTGGKFVRPSID